MFRTALPFGYLVIALALIAILVAGTALLIAGLRRRQSRTKWFGGALIAAVILAGLAEFAFDTSLEWNPVIASDTEITGVWQDDDERLTLRPDHTYLYEDETHSSSGIWKRQDWNLFLEGKITTVTMRFIQLGADYRLLPRPPVESDLWDGDTGLLNVSR